MGEHEEPEGYDGDVTVVVGADEPRAARAALAARFDPLSGHVVWTGRVSVRLAPRTAMTITTSHGSAPAVAVEPDPWGNTRVRGSGRPPFPVELLDGAQPPAR